MIIEPLENFQCVHYISGNRQHEELLDRYMKTTDVENNNSRKNLKVHLYDGTNGVLFLIINLRTNSIDAMSSCVKYIENNVVSAKVWHRLHIKPNVPKGILDMYFEPNTFKWCIDNKIVRLWMTFNETNVRAALWASIQMGERRNINRPNKKSQMYGDHMRKGMRPYDKFIFEQYTWQSVIYYSPDNTFFLTREEKPLNNDMTEVFKREYPNATQTWL
jgi:hypothetical protein